MTEQNDTKRREGSEQRQHERRRDKNRREITLPVDNDHRKGHRRTGKDRRQKP